MLSGLPERLHKELVSAKPNLKDKINVVANPNRDQYVWKGASAFATTAYYLRDDVGVSIV
jgi:actin-related protein